MKVKELIEYLEKCNPEHTVGYEDNNEIRYVIEHVDIIKPENSYVELS